MSPLPRAPEVTAAFLAQSLQPNVYAATIIPFVLSVTAVAARLWCRWKKNAGLKIDDFLILFALLALTGLTADTLWMLQHSLGKHIQTGGPNVVYNFFLGWFIGEVTYTTVIIFVKFSVLALYWRLFSPLNVRWEIWVMTTITFLWGAAVYICMMQHCVPLRKYWDHDVPGVCRLDDQEYFFAISIPNILIDATLLALPVRYIARLEMGRRQKQVVSGLFLLGGFVCIASILRLVSVVTSNVADPDSTWVFVKQCIWAIVECNAAVVCACLPCLAPIFTLIWPSFYTKPKKPVEPPLDWTIGSEPRKKGSYPMKDSYTTETFLLSRNDDRRVPDGVIEVKKDWAVASDAASSTQGSNRGMPYMAH